jgi:hypothetical protein
MAELRALLSARAPLYQQASLCVDTSALSAEEVLEALFTQLR